MLYILNAWVSENHFCIAQKKVEDKSNGITAIPEILSGTNIEDAVVSSINAMGTQNVNILKIPHSPFRNP